ncbi:hypothetical protein [Polaribacter sp. Hel1_85]|uniref:DUF7477 domain-containing protein n=1 Tax=Polaribacter sp. Hel1_85 TaxID=1250005 RepID=UPI00052DB823|nr:hypothetical protein [Polaribacter sp. Hel1_85]KGL63448.1 hypothetical protein PHEL85_0484 [Polaribacter sp. Hel1_85]
MKYIVFFLLITNSLLSQQNHYVVLEKISYDQKYKVSNNFPNDWINNNWEKGFNIELVSFKNNEWFVVLDKYKKRHKQVFLTNPSQKQLNDKSKDGYIIRDICLYTKNNKINRLYALAKISINPISNYYTVGKSDKNSNTSKTIKKAKTNSKICKNMKSIKLGNNIQYLFLAYGTEKNSQKYNWSSTYRVDFPQDLIENKKHKAIY